MNFKLQAYELGLGLTFSKRKTIDRRDMTSPASDLSTRSAKFALSKRRTDCWNYQLDHAGVDSAYEGLKGWAGNGRDLQSYPDANAYIAYISKGAMAYYCINRPNSKGNLDVRDVQYALEQMDAKCVRYDASWFAWDGTSEIVGKARASDLVCQGGCC